MDAGDVWPCGRGEVGDLGGHLHVVVVVAVVVEGVAARIATRGLPECRGPSCACDLTGYGWWRTSCWRMAPHCRPRNGEAGSTAS
jgi:hypothetical protein